MRGNRTNITIVALTLLVMLSFTGCVDKAGEQLPGFAVGLEKVLNFYRQDQNELESWWEIVALYGADASFGEGPWQLPAWASEDLPPGSSATAYTGFILGLIAQEQDPWAWQGRHLPAELSSLQLKDGSFGGSINNTIWAMLALDVAGFSYAQEEALTYLMGDQKTDGGFALTGSTGDPDVTAMALLALSFHRDNPAAEAAVQRSLDFLKNVMLPSGGYASYNAENANSTAIVLSALAALGEDCQEPPWLTENRGPLEALLTYQLDDGSFSFFQDPLKGDNMATYQALIALGDAAAGTSVFQRLQAEGEKYRREMAKLQQAEPPHAEPESGSIEKGTAVSLVSKYEGGRILYTLDGSDPWEEGLEYTEPLILEEEVTLKAVAFVLGMRGSEEASFAYSIKEEKPVAQSPGSSDPKPKPPTSPTEPPKVTTISLKVDGILATRQVLVSGSSPTVLDALKQGLEEANIEYTIVNIPGLGLYVKSIGGISESSSGGWMFKVNGKAPNEGAATYKIKNGDTILWWFAS